MTFEVLTRSRRTRRSIFDSFFDDPFGKTVQKTLSSKPIKIEVSDLPKEGRPAGFSGAVGSFKIEAKIDKNQVQMNDAVTLKVRLSGSGNIKLANIPKLDITADIEQYDPKIATKINKNSNRISGYKTAEYVLIPRYEGNYTIKPIYFSWFDPSTKSYKTQKAGPFTIEVKGGTAAPGGIGAQPGSYSRKEVTLLGKDIHYIKEFSEFRTIGYKPWMAFSFWAVIIITILFFTAFYFYNEHHAALNKNKQLARRQKAGKLAVKQLSVAKKLMHNSENEAFYKAISNAMQGFVQDKLSIDLTDFSAVNVEKALNSKNIDPEVIKDYMAILQESDFRQYASFSAKDEDRGAVFEKAKKVLTRLEKWI